MHARSTCTIVGYTYNYGGITDVQSQQAFARYEYIFVSVDIRDKWKRDWSHARSRSTGWPVADSSSLSVSLYLARRLIGSFIASRRNGSPSSREVMSSSTCLETQPTLAIRLILTVVLPLDWFWRATSNASVTSSIRSQVMPSAPMARAICKLHSALEVMGAHETSANGGFSSWVPT